MGNRPICARWRHRAGRAPTGCRSLVAAERDLPVSIAEVGSMVREPTGAEHALQRYRLERREDDQFLVLIEGGHSRHDVVEWLPARSDDRTGIKRRHLPPPVPPLASSSPRLSRGRGGEGPVPAAAGAAGTGEAQ